MDEFDEAVEILGSNLNQRLAPCNMNPDRDDTY